MNTKRRMYHLPKKSWSEKVEVVVIFTIAISIIAALAGTTWGIYEWRLVVMAIVCGGGLN